MFKFQMIASPAIKVFFIVCAVVLVSNLKIASAGQMDVSSRTDYAGCEQGCIAFDPSSCQAYWTPDNQYDYYGYGVCRVVANQGYAPAPTPPPPYVPPSGGVYGGGAGGGGGGGGASDAPPPGGGAFGQP